jgi:hypothetical protein
MIAIVAQRHRASALAATFWVLLTLLIASRPAGAQTDPQDRLAAELDQTDRVLDEAREVVAASENQRARTVLDHAKELQGTARGLFARCDRDHLVACEGAARATTRARRQAFYAIRVAREQSSLEQQVTRTIERASHLYDEARRQMAGEELSPRAETLLDEAQAQLERARERYQARQFAVALELAQTAERLLRQALDLGERGEVGPERVRHELERTARLIERARPIIEGSGNDQAARHLERGLELQGRAHAELAAGRLLVALRLTREAREQVHRALRRSNDLADRDAVIQAIHQTERLIERTAPVVRASDDQDAIRLLEAGIQHQEQARSLLAEERFPAALAQTRVARNLVLEASQRVDGVGM